MKKRTPLITAAALMTAMTVHATEAAPETAGQMVNPNAQYTYAETAECMNSIAIFGNVTGVLSKVIGNAATAMLGRLPACEVEKVILAGGSEETKKLIQMRRRDIQNKNQ